MLHNKSFQHSAPRNNNHLYLLAQLKVDWGRGVTGSSGLGSELQLGWGLHPMPPGSLQWVGPSDVRSGEQALPELGRPGRAQRACRGEGPHNPWLRGGHGSRDVTQGYSGGCRIGNSSVVFLLDHCPPPPAPPAGPHSGVSAAGAGFTPFSCTSRLDPSPKAGVARVSTKGEGHRRSGW